MTDTPDLYMLTIIKITDDGYRSVSKYEGVTAASCQSLLGTSLLSTDGMSSLLIEIQPLRPAAHKPAPKHNPRGWSPGTNEP
jgi:hypothetical protein